MVRKEEGLRGSKMYLENGWWLAGEIGYPISNHLLPYRVPPGFEEFKQGGNSSECLWRGPARK